MSIFGLKQEDHPDLHKQQEAARRLGFESAGVSVYEFNAILMNRIADLEERVAKLYEASSRAQTSRNGLE